MKTTQIMARVWTNVDDADIPSTIDTPTVTHFTNSENQQCRVVYDRFYNDLVMHTPSGTRSIGPGPILANVISITASDTEVGVLYIPDGERAPKFARREHSEREWMVDPELSNSYDVKFFRDPHSGVWCTAQFSRNGRFYIWYRGNKHLIDFEVKPDLLISKIQANEYDQIEMYVQVAQYTQHFGRLSLRDGKPLTTRTGEPIWSVKNLV